MESCLRASVRPPTSQSGLSMSHLSSHSHRDTPRPSSPTGVSTCSLTSFGYDQMTWSVPPAADGLLQSSRFPVHLLPSPVQCPTRQLSRPLGVGSTLGLNFLNPWAINARLRLLSGPAPG